MSTAKKGILVLIIVLSLSYLLDLAHMNIVLSVYSDNRISIKEKPSIWYSPEGELPQTFEDYIESSAKLPPSILDEAEKPNSPFYVSSDTGESIYLLVTLTIYNEIATSLIQYIRDVELDGYSVSLFLGSWTTPEDVRTLLYSGLANEIKGCLLIGDIPVAWYELDNADPGWSPHEEFPTDLFYMDLDGNWIDNDGDGIYDEHSGNITPEIWVGRLKVSNLGDDEGLLLNNYFNKNHCYRIGLLTLPQRSLVYVDDDWVASANEDEADLMQVYLDTTLIKEQDVTTSEDYKNRIIEGFEWLHLRCHGSSFSHTFKISEDQWDGTVYNDDYSAIDPDVFFYQLFVCSAARFTENNYLAGTCVFKGNNGLLSIGSTKTGSMLYFNLFYNRLSQGYSIGDAFKDWFSTYGEIDPKWFYGLEIIGDPLLQPMLPQNRPEISLAAISVSAQSNYSVDDLEYLGYSYDLYDENNASSLFSGDHKTIYAYSALVIGEYAATSTIYATESNLIKALLIDNSAELENYVETGGGLLAFAQNDFLWLPLELRGNTILGDRIGGEINQYFDNRITEKPHCLQMRVGINTKPPGDNLYSHHFITWEGQNTGTQHGIYINMARDDWTFLSDVTTWIVGPYGRGKISLTTMLLDYYCGNEDTKFNSFFRRRLTIENMIYGLVQNPNVPYDYPTIQSAINAANIGDTVFVSSGTYYENVVINKSISIIGENKTNTIIDGSLTGNVLNITASNVNVSSFAIRRSGTDTDYSGIWISGPSSSNNITNNIITENYNGIYLLSNSANNTISQNVVTANTYNGIYLSASSNNSIIGNFAAYSSRGIEIYYSSDNNSIKENTITMNEQGLRFDYSSNNIINQNQIEQNAYGLLLFYSTNNIMVGNSVTENNQSGIYIWSETSGNEFYHNKMNNPNQVDNLGSSNVWDNGYPNGGNYWVDYSGVDANGDGVGDTPYIIDSNNQDRYPLMEPWTEQKDMYLVVRGSNNVIYCKTFDPVSGSWGSWAGLSGSTPDSPAAAVINNELHLVVRGVNYGQIWHGYVNLTDDSFSGFTLLSGSTPSAPTLTGNSTHLCLVVRGNNNVIYYRFYDVATRTWGGWIGVPGGSTLSTPAAELMNDELHVVVRGANYNQIWHGTVDVGTGGFSGWTLLTGATPSPPVLTSNSTHLCLVVRGNNNVIYYRWYDLASEVWGGWTGFPYGSTPDVPAATIVGDSLQIVVRGMNHDQIWHGTLDLSSDEWSGWTLLDGSTPTNPTLTS